MADEPDAPRSKSERRYSPSMRPPSKQDKERESMMKKLGITHDDLMNEFNARLQAMKTPTAPVGTPDNPALSPSMRTAE